MLKGHTLFITGASRGIGKALALRAARDGANITIAAKTADPHPTLPGTIYTAAEEIENAGGKALPLQVDIRDEASVKDAMEQTVKKFGGIDILVNNASAISITPSLTTNMKKYDLMNQINARGTYMCSHYALPHILKSAASGKQSHILNMAPPLDLNPHAFAACTAYMIAKSGMSMCTLGMAGEFRDEGVAVNSLWPRTGIYTEAWRVNFGGGDEASKYGCRTEDIVVDSSYDILCQDPKKVSGNFFIDENYLRDNCGVTDFGKYECVPGAPLSLLFA